MKKNKIVLFALSLVAVAAVGVGSTLAYFTDSDEATNVFTMGNIDVELEEPGWEEPDDVMPGDVYTKDPTVIIAEGSMDCYVRLEVTYEGLTEDQIAMFFDEDVEDGNINIQEGWVKNGNYYYWPEALSAGESKTLFTEVAIPKSWGNEMAGASIQINVKAEAVQADNFDGELEKDENGNIIGWGDVVIAEYKAAE